MTIGTPKSVEPKGSTASTRIGGIIVSFGRNVIVELVDAVRDEIFLQQELERVRDRLTESEQRDILLESKEGQRDANAVGSHAVLNKRADLALGVDGIGDKPKDDAQQHERLEERGPDQETPRA